MPIAEKANSVMLLRPMTTAPAARSRATAAAFAARVGDARERRLDEPAARGLARGELLRERRDRADGRFSHGSLPGPRRRLALRGLVVVMHFEQEAARFRLERAVRRSRRAASVGAGPEACAALAVAVVADDQIARDEIHLFPVIVHEGLGRMHAGIEAQVARAKAALLLFVEESGEHLLPDPVRIARQFFPAAIEVDLVELLVLLLDRHGSSFKRAVPSVRDLERTSGVLVRKAAVLHLVVQLDLESLAAGDLAPHRECATEHRGPRRKSPA